MRSKQPGKLHVYIIHQPEYGEKHSKYSLNEPNNEFPGPNLHLLSYLGNASPSLHRHVQYGQRDRKAYMRVGYPRH